MAIAIKKLEQNDIDAFKEAALKTTWKKQEPLFRQ